jgi:hypothetical protein
MALWWDGEEAREIAVCEVVAMVRMLTGVGHWAPGPGGPKGLGPGRKNEW